MAQHITQSKTYRNVSERDIHGLSEREAWKKLAEYRWGSAEAMPCSWCGEHGRHYVIATRYQWRCRYCQRVFSVTSGTPFHGRRLPFTSLLSLLFNFVVRTGGIAPNQLCGQLGVTLRTAAQNIAKIREALHATQDRTPLEGRVHIDGAHFCGKPRRPRRRTRMTTALANHHLRNRKAAIVPNVSVSTMEPWNIEKLENRRVVITLRQVSCPGEQRAQRTITAVVKRENAASVVPIIRRHVAPGARVETDDGHAYSTLSSWYDHRTVRHSQEYSTPDGINNNHAEQFFSRMRRAEYGVHHGMRPQYLAFYAADTAWRDDLRGRTLKEKLTDMIRRVLRCGMSRAFRRYCQGHRLKVEYLG